MHPRLNERTEKPNGRRANMPQARAKSAAVKVNPNRPKGKLNPPSKEKNAPGTIQRSKAKLNRSRDQLNKPAVKPNWPGPQIFQATTEPKAGRAKLIKSKSKPNMPTTN